MIFAMDPAGLLGKGHIGMFQQYLRLLHAASDIAMVAPAKRVLDNFVWTHEGITL
jgi:hypothetical protein